MDDVNPNIFKMGTTFPVSKKRDNNLKIWKSYGKAHGIHDIL